MKTLNRKQVALLTCTAVVATGSFVFGSPVDFLLDTLHGARDAAGALLQDPSTMLAPLFAQAVVQSSYSETMVPGTPGMIASMNNYRVESRTVENSNGVPFGRAVGRGTLDRGCRLGAAATGQFLGVSVRDITLSPTLDSIYVDTYQQNALAGILAAGDIWVTTGGAVADGEDVTFNSLTGVLSTIATGGTQFIVTGARWMTTAGSGGLAIVRIPDYGQGT